jgi:hypothetical protein
LALPPPSGCCCRRAPASPMVGRRAAGPPPAGRPPLADLDPQGPWGGGMGWMERGHSLRGSASRRGGLGEEEGTRDAVPARDGVGLPRLGGSATATGVGWVDHDAATRLPSSTHSMNLPIVPPCLLRFTDPQLAKASCGRIPDLPSTQARRHNPERWARAISLVFRFGPRNVEPPHALSFLQLHGQAAKSCFADGGLVSRREGLLDLFQYDIMETVLAGSQPRPLLPPV